MALYDMLIDVAKPYFGLGAKRWRIITRGSVLSCLSFSIAFLSAGRLLRSSTLAEAARRIAGYFLDKKSRSCPGSRACPA